MPNHYPSEPAGSVGATDEQKNDRDAGPITEERVGYGRPPMATRFAPGKSGNPRGRPRGTRSVGAILQDVFGQKVSVTENGRTRRVPAIEGMLRRLANDALRGEAGAMKLLLSLLERYGDSAETTVKLADMLAEDKEILALYLQRSDEREPTASTGSTPSAVNEKIEGGDDDAPAI